MTSNNAERRDSLLVVPVYNEVERLDVDVMLRMAEAATFDLLLVDDGSTDDSFAMCEAISAKSAHVFALRLMRNGGKSNALLAGFRYAVDGGYAFAGMADADMSVSESDISVGNDLIRHAESGVVSGARVRLAGHGVLRPAIRQWAGRLIATAVTIASGIPMYDPQSPCKWFVVDDAFRKAIQRPCDSKWFGEAELLSRLDVATRRVKRRNLSVYEFPLNSWYEAEGGHLGIGQFTNVVGDFGRFVKAARIWDRAPV